jgi:hypothetical protein
VEETVNNRNIWNNIGYFGFIYLILLVIIAVGYPLAQEYAKPIAAIIFPINENTSVMKTILVMSGMYWVMVGGYLFISNKKPDAP